MFDNIVDAIAYIESKRFGVVNLKTDIEKRALMLGKYIAENNATVRATAKNFGFSKSGVHKDVTTRLMDIDPLLAERVQEVLDINKAERHIRGGLATKLKYERKKVSNG